jgi:hypothetical protein
MTTNPLHRYYRQPKIYISLPSKGIYYPVGALSGDPSNVPIFGMTGIDELTIKTPDALFNGEATVKLIESCCPSIVHASAMPVTDLDAILVAIRIATSGSQMAVTHECSSCKETSDYEFNLHTVIERYSHLKFNNIVEISPETTVCLKPLSYKDLSEFSVSNFKIQKTLMQIKELDDDAQRIKLDEIYTEIKHLQLELMVQSIESVNVPECVVDQRPFIKEWLENSEKEVYEKIKLAMEKNKSDWELAPFTVKCSNEECGAENKVSITLDYSSFFD